LPACHPQKAPSHVATFCAIFDPCKEVRDPIAQLEKWSVTQWFAIDGVVAGAVKSEGDAGILETI
jgi:hypothetical protein